MEKTSCQRRHAAGLRCPTPPRTDQSPRSVAQISKRSGGASSVALELEAGRDGGDRVEDSIELLGRHEARGALGAQRGRGLLGECEGRRFRAHGGWLAERLRRQEADADDDGLTTLRRAARGASRGSRKRDQRAVGERDSTPSGVPSRHHAPDPSRNGRRRRHAARSLLHLRGRRPPGKVGARTCSLQRAAARTPRSSRRARRSIHQTVHRSRRAQRGRALDGP